MVAKTVAIDTSNVLEMSSPIEQDPNHLEHPVDQLRSIRGRVATPFLSAVILNKSKGGVLLLLAFLFFWS